MDAWLILLSLVAQLASIGSALDDGVQLIYESGGVAQAPWVFDSVRVAARPTFTRCVVVSRRAQPAREYCARGDTLFESAAQEFRATRVIGPNLRLEVRTAAGDVMVFETSRAEQRSISGTAIDYLPTTIVTRNAAGVVTRRLREEYAPALLTALRGTFEEPDGASGWRVVREFSLAELRRR